MMDRLEYAIGVVRVLGGDLGSDQVVTVAVRHLGNVREELRAHIRERSVPQRARRSRNGTEAEWAQAHREIRAAFGVEP